MDIFKCPSQLLSILAQEAFHTAPSPQNLHEKQEFVYYIISLSLSKARAEEKESNYWLNYFNLLTETHFNNQSICSGWVLLTMVKLNFHL